MQNAIPRRKSIATRLSLIVGGALVAAVLVVGGLALVEQNRQLTRALETKAESLAQFMAQVSPLSILSLNFVEMNNNVKKVVLTDDEAIYAVIVNEQNIPLAWYFKETDSAVTAAARERVQARDPLGASEAVKRSTAVLEVQAPIGAGDRRIGSAVVGFSFEPMHRALMVQIGLIGGILVVVTGISLLLLGFALRKMLQPVGELTAAATQISTGDLDVVLKGTERGDELGVLARTFQSMAKQLRELIAGMEDRMAELQRMGQALQKSEEEFRRIVATANEGIWVLTPDMRTTFVNPRMADMLGCTVESMLGRVFSDFMFEEDLLDQQRKFDNRMHGIAENYERRFRHSDGHAVWTHVSAAPIIEDGRYAGSFGMVTDITARKQAEDEIRRFNQELEQRVAERTAQLESANKELEAFSYSVSHDLRAPLRAIDGFSHILLDDYNDKLDDEGKRLLKVVRDNTQRMGQLIDDILKFSRAGRTEIAASEIDMEKLAHEVVAELAPIDGGGKAKFEIGPLPHAMGDRAMIRQVMVNLIANAIKFSRGKEAPMVSVSGSVEGGEALYSVKDNGVGFDNEYGGRLFAVFQRLHNNKDFEGTGVGLAIVKRIVNRHGGRVWADGKVGEGATIGFTLPPA